MARSRPLPSGRADFFKLISPRAVAVFHAGVFFVFAPVAVLLVSAFERTHTPGGWLVLGAVSGALAVSWAATFVVSRWFVVGIVLFTLAVMGLSGPFAPLIGAVGRPPQPAGVAIVASIVLGYVLFVLFINGQGRTGMRLMTEMALAERIHRALVPAIAHAGGGLDVEGASVASAEMGGDLIERIDHGDSTDLFLADVSGHGVSAGVVMGMVKSAIRMGLREGRELRALAADLNDVLEQTTSPEMYATLAALRVRHANREVECVLAGHSEVFVVRAGGGATTRAGERGRPLGLLGGQAYPAVRLTCDPGDLLAAWTDGFDETCDARGRELGREAIERAIAERHDRPLAEIREAVFDLAHNHGPQTDDRSLLLLRFG